MTSNQGEYSSELKGILEKRFSLENTIERYVKLFPSKVIEYKEKFGCSEEEASYILYTSDYLITSTEIKGLQDEERIDALFDSMIFGRDKGHIYITTQLTLIELSQQLSLGISRHFNYQRDRGFPISVIKSQIVSSWLRDFFEMLRDFIPNIDIRWIMAEIEGSYFGKFAKERYLEIVKEFEIDKLDVENYYISAEYLVERFNFKFTEEDEKLISRTSYETQTQHTEAIMSVSSENEIIVGSTYAISIDEDIISSLKIILSNIPKTASENGSIELKYYQCFIRKIPIGTGKRIFVVIENNNERQIIFILISSGLDDINYTSLREVIRQYLVDAICLHGKNKDKKIETINLWAERILVSQTVEGSEVFGLPTDLDREREWVLDSILSASKLKGKENSIILARIRQHENVKNNVENIVKLNGILHEFVESIDHDLNFSFEIIPFEAYFEGEDVQDGVLSLIHNEKGKYAHLNFQSLFSNSDMYIHRKKHLVKRKYSRLKVRELASRSGLDLETWAASSLEFKDYGYTFSTINSTVNLVEEHAGKVVEKEEVKSDTSVSDRLKDLEMKKDLQLDIQKVIYQYLTESVNSYVKIAIVDDIKLKEFFTKEYKNQIIREERKNLEDIIDKYRIRKLPGKYGEKLLDVVNTIDNSFTRSVRDGLFKLQDIEQNLDKSEKIDLETIYNTISENLISAVEKRKLETQSKQEEIKKQIAGVSIRLKQGMEFIDYAEINKAKEIYDEISNLTSDNETIKFQLNMYSSLILIFQERFEEINEIILHGEKYFTSISDEEKNDLKEWEGVLYFCKGEILNNQLQYDMALAFYQKSIKIYEGVDNNQKLSILNIRMGSIYQSQGEFNKAIELYKKGQNLNTQLGDNIALINTYNKLGYAYFQQADFENAEKNYKESLSLSTKIANQSASAVALLYLGKIYFVKNDLDLALENLRFALDIQKKMANEKLIADTLFKLVLVTIEKSEINKAESYATELEQHSEIIEDNTAKQKAILSRGLLLINKKRAIHKIEAQKIFRSIVDDKILDYQILIIAMYELCKLLVDELKNYNEEDVLVEIDKLINKIFDIGVAKKLVWLQIDVTILQLKTALIWGDISKANRHLEKAKELSNETDKYKELIDNEASFLNTDDWRDPEFINLTYRQKAFKTEITAFLSNSKEINRENIYRVE